MAAFSAYCWTEPLRFLVTELKKYLQYWATLSHPSVSTQITESWPLDAAAAAAEPIPVPPATGKTTSAPCCWNCWVICLPLLASVNELAKVPPFWFFSFQPSTWTFLPFCLL